MRRGHHLTRVKVVPVESLPPLCLAGLAVDKAFLLTRFYRRYLTRPCACARLHGIVNFRRARGEHLHHIPWDLGDFKQAVLSRIHGGIAERLNLRAQDFTLHLPPRHLQVIHLLPDTVAVVQVAAQRPPLLAVMGGVKQQRVGVQMHFTVAVNVVSVKRHQRAAGFLQADFAVLRDAAVNAFLKLGERFLHRGPESLNQPRVAAHQPQNGNAFRRAEGQVEAGTAGFRAVLQPGQAAPVREVSVQDGIERFGPHLPPQAQRFCPFPEPLAFVVINDFVVFGATVVTGIAVNGAQCHHGYISGSCPCTGT